MKKIIDHWTFESPPRKNQIEAFDWLETVSAKYIFLELPVGSGKSNIAVTYSKFLSNRGGDSFILTPQKILQTQYENSFPNEIIASLYGKGNYPCASTKATCDIGGALQQNKCPNCPYERAKAHAKSKPNVVLNYTIAMLLFNFTKVFERPRKLMVLDECHNIEDFLTEFNAVQITEVRAKKYGVKLTTARTLKGALDWVGDIYLPAVSKYANKFFNDNEHIFDKAGFELTASDLKIVREYSGLQEHVEELTNLVSESPDILDNFYVLVHDKSSVKFKHLTGAINFHRILEPKAERFLFMSSTILNYQTFCKDIGVDPKESAFLSLGSEFPVENRPVFYIPKMKMNMGWNQPENSDKRENMITGIKNLLDIHKEDSGIIHTASFQVAQWIVESLDDVDHIIMHHNPSSGDNRNDVINAFMKSKKPTILISPSITEGLDFKEDLSRFAIIAKIPFPQLGDQWIKRRQEISNEWYLRRTIISVIQSTGRIVRSSSDWGHTYILDSSFDYLFNETKHMIPTWWKEATRKI